MWLIRSRWAAVVADVGADVPAAVVAAVVADEWPASSSLVPISASLPVVSPGSAAPARRSAVCLAHEKTPAIRRGFWLVLGLACLALIPPSSPLPGAGNEYDYALNTDLYEAKKTEEGYVDQADILHGNLHATTIRPHEDGDVAAVPAVEQAQPGSP
jgi:hypothetical protein